jgi:endo-1,4-beta-xylanase
MLRYYYLLTLLIFPLFCQSDEPLRTYADRCSRFVGAAVSYNPLRYEPTYGEVLAREFNILTTENALKFKYTEPYQDRFTFGQSDYIVNFAEEHNMKVRGHTLIWHNSLPSWVENTNWTRDELLDVLETHIKTVVSRYRGRVQYWDVVNEGLDNQGNYRSTIWYDTIGPEYLELAFQWAHEADPDALLFYNDYQTEGKGEKSDGVYELVKYLKEKDVPIHGVGLQLHRTINGDPYLEDMLENLKRLNDIGMEVHITELDVRIQVPSREFALNRMLDIQARRYRDAMEVVLQSENCPVLIMWGFTDKHSWIPHSHEGYDYGLIFDELYEPKPAYFSMSEALQKFLSAINPWMFY